MVKTLYHRALQIPSDETGRAEEIKRVTQALNINNYPKEFIRKHRDSVLKPRPRQSASSQQPAPVGYATLPYISGVTDKIRRILTQHDIRVSF